MYTHSKHLLIFFMSILGSSLQRSSSVYSVKLRATTSYALSGISGFIILSI